MNLIIILSLVKTVLIMVLLHKLSYIAIPLRIIFMSKMFIFGLFQYIYFAILYDKINVNKLPYIGCIFIAIDSVILNIVHNMQKN